ncbi:MAG: transketolase [Bacteroidales bacterium]
MVFTKDIASLKDKARTIRYDILTMLYHAGSGHLGGSLGLADVFTVLYFSVLNHDPKNPNWEKRDKLILSNGHVAPVLYATLANCGYFDKQELLSLRKLGSRLQGNASFCVGLPGIETASGSLGQGLSIAAGMAIADKIDNKNRKIYCICGDGEMQEGQVWEAIMAISHHKLKNVVLIIDKNNVQIDGFTKDVMNIDPLDDKLKSFGWSVHRVNGHDFQDLLKVFGALDNDYPNVILAETVMGKGVPEIEGDYNWHGKAPDCDQYHRFINQLY